MADLVKIETGPGLRFDVLVDGPVEAPLVLLLHGFAESMQCWRAGLSADERVEGEGGGDGDFFKLSHSSLRRSGIGC